MKFALQAGAELDILSTDEAEQLNDRLVRAIRRSVPDPTIVYSSASLQVNAAGVLGGGGDGAGQVVYTAPTGRGARINRLALDASAYTPATPLVTGWLAWYRNAASSQGLVAFLPEGSNPAILPAVFTEGRTDACVLRSGESLVFVGAGLPANLLIGVNLQVELLETTTDIDWA